jgi:hypothetical protein
MPEFPILHSVYRMTPNGTNRLEYAIRCLMIEALHLSGGCASEAAKVLGISERTMNYRMRQHGLRLKDGVEWAGSRLRVTDERAELFFASHAYERLKRREYLLPRTSRGE